MRWYETPPLITPHGVLAVDMFVLDVVAGLLTQIEERHCPLCERLTGYAHQDWAYRALPCGKTTCRWFVAGRLDMFKRRDARSSAVP